MWNPWGKLRLLSHVLIEWARPHPVLPAATNGVDRIWLDPGATQVERRCLLTHELVHLELEHLGCQPGAVERLVRNETARRLIPLGALKRELPWALSHAELADCLWVTELVLADRLAGLSPAELAVLMQLDLQTT